MKKRNGRQAYRQIYGLGKDGMRFALFDLRNALHERATLEGLEMNDAFKLILVFAIAVAALVARDIRSTKTPLISFKKHSLEAPLASTHR